MTTLYLTTPGATLSASSRSLEVRRAGEEVARCPTLGLARVVALAPTHITSEALTLCSRESVELVVVPRGPRGAVRIGLTEDALRLRAAQHRVCVDEPFRLTMSRAIVQGKLRNQQRCLGRARARREPEVREARDALINAAGACDRAGDTATLRGIEGNGSAAYYRGLRHLLNPEFGFERRNRRPPKDPANALLSFAYTLLASEAVAGVMAAGLEPALGCYHEAHRGRPSLALDLMEEFRAPVADTLVVAVTSRRIITPGNFQEREGGVRMNARARRRLIRAYESKMTTPLQLTPQSTPTTLRDTLRDQAARMARAILNEEAYVPFRMP